VATKNRLNSLKKRLRNELILRTAVCVLAELANTDVKAVRQHLVKISQIDVFPTLCDLLGFERPEWLEGKSFLPVLQHKQEEINEAIFGEVTYHAAYEPKRCVRTKRWKYIRHFDGRHQPNLPNCDDGLSKDYWLKFDWRDNETISDEQLFDLTFDPAERSNLAADPGHEAVLTKMKAHLHNWMENTHDPLLKGPVPLTPGGHTVSPDKISPTCFMISNREWSGRPRLNYPGYSSNAARMATGTSPKYRISASRRRR
jgi:hypothetical protein